MKIFLFLQTNFVDCLMEQTHSDIAKREDKDVSYKILKKSFQKFKVL